MLKIAIDAMGGDFGPQPIVEGVISALKKDRHFQAILVGKKDELLPLIPQKLEQRIIIHEADDVISMTDHATDALKRKLQKQEQNRYPTRTGHSNKTKKETREQRSQN
eukprot:Anaeramoba_ignava/a353714_34.p3 GENE.a353714_34~~a353714_34.p3  ORF type:complete len:108 (-),score=11.97 a353714_34:8-331(-)